MHNRCNIGKISTFMRSSMSLEKSLKISCGWVALLYRRQLMKEVMTTNIYDYPKPLS